ncbi:MAG: SPASM domain-containing protein [Saccharofermentanales bacterium]
MNDNMHYFSSLIKPASSLCNMRCEYCFYADVTEHRQVKSYGLMDIGTAEIFIDKVFAYLKEQTTITFAFQGGEPTLAGLPFYRRFTEYVESRKSSRFTIAYSIQTNGYILDDEWCSFLSEHNFLVGVSIDATKEIHDFYRKNAQNEGTFQRVIKSLRLLEKHNVDFNILSVISREFAKHPAAVYNSYQKNKIEYVQMIPCLNPFDMELDPKTDLTPRMYAKFMKDIFALWEADLRKNKIIHIREFENIISQLKGNKAEQCGLMGYCTPQFVLEADGGVYPCDFYVLDTYRAGSIIENSIEEIEKSEGVKRFLQYKEKEHPLCQSCMVYKLCGGGCKRNRAFFRTDESYCPYQDFLYSTIDRFAEIARNL